jgi:hypothetical protein
LAARTPAEAVAAFVEPLGRAVSCITNAVINVRGGYQPSVSPHAITLNDGTAVRLASDLFIVISQWYRIVEDAESREPWNVSVIGYLCSLDVAGQEIISYQWHPAAPSPVTFPHLHVGAGA